MFNLRPLWNPTTSIFFQGCQLNTISLQLLIICVLYCQIHFKLNKHFILPQTASFQKSWWTYYKCVNSDFISLIWHFTGSYFTHFSPNRKTKGKKQLLKSTNNRCVNEQFPSPYYPFSWPLSAKPHPACTEYLSFSSIPLLGVTSILLQ